MSNCLFFCAPSLLSSSLFKSFRPTPQTKECKVCLTANEIYIPPEIPKLSSATFSTEYQTSLSTLEGGSVWEDTADSVDSVGSVATVESVESIKSVKSMPNLDDEKSRRFHKFSYSSSFGSFGVSGPRDAPETTKFVRKNICGIRDVPVTNFLNFDEPPPSTRTGSLVCSSHRLPKEIPFIECPKEDGEMLCPQRTVIDSGRWTTRSANACDPTLGEKHRRSRSSSPALRRCPTEDREEQINQVPNILRSVQSLPIDVKPKPTHFICLRINDEEILRNLKDFQTKVIEQTPRLQPCWTDPQRFHISLLVFSAQPSDSQIAINAFEKGLKEFNSFLKKNNVTELKLSFGRVKTLTDKVLFADVDDPEASLLSELNSCLRDEFLKHGLWTAGQRAATNRRGTEQAFRRGDFIPHLTILKTTHTLRKAKRSHKKQMKIEASHFTPFLDRSGRFEFGTQNVSEALIVELRNQEEHSKFYKIISNCKLIN